MSRSVSHGQWENLTTFPYVAQDNKVGEKPIHKTNRTGKEAADIPKYCTCIIHTSEGSGLEGSYTRYSAQSAPHIKQRIEIRHPTFQFRFQFSSLWIYVIDSITFEGTNKRGARTNQKLCMKLNGHYNIIKVFLKNEVQ